MATQPAKQGRHYRKSCKWTILITLAILILPLFFSVVVAVASHHPIWGGVVKMWTVDGIGCLYSIAMIAGVAIDFHVEESVSGNKLSDSNRFTIIPIIMIVFVVGVYVMLEANDNAEIAGTLENLQWFSVIGAFLYATVQKGKFYILLSGERR